MTMNSSAVRSPGSGTTGSNGSGSSIGPSNVGTKLSPAASSGVGEKKGHNDFDMDAYHRWRDEVGTEVAYEINLSRPSLKVLVCLALLERKGIPTSYDEILETIQNRGIYKQSSATQTLEQLFPKEGMRVAVSNLTHVLRSKGHSLELVSQRVGREARMVLRARQSDDSTQNLSSVREESRQGRGDFLRLKEPLIEPLSIARSLLRDGGGLPFASAYSTYRAAAKWLSFSNSYSHQKRHYEANAFEAYNLDEIVLKGTSKINVVSLAPGEGLGETELLAKVLKKHSAENGLKVKYLAVDTSEILLRSHSILVNERFSNEIASGILEPQFVVGDLYELKRVLSAIRSRNQNNFMESGPVLCTFFGNCLGNNEYHEWQYFKSLLEAFPRNRPIASLVGVSLVRTNAKGRPIQEKYSLDPFWLETPRHLLYELELLKSLSPDQKSIPLNENSEFIPSEDPSGVASYIPFAQYETNIGVKGVVYRFYYKLKNDLATSDGQERMCRGQQIHLYSIIKYDLSSLIRSIQERGFSVKSPPENYEVQRITSGEEEFRYGVFAAVKN
jgi:hypothetical protein